MFVGLGFHVLMKTWVQEFRKTAVLAFPIVLSQVSQHLVQVIDAAMIGRVGVVPLAASAFAAGIFTVPLVFCFGITITTSVLTSSAFGSGDLRRANHVLRVGLMLSTIIGLVFASGLDLAKEGLQYFGQSEDVLLEAKPYFSLLVWSIVPVLIFSCFKNYSEAMNRPWMPLKIVLLMLVSNAFLNWVFIFGKLGFPAMGLIGAGWGTLLSRTLSAVVIICIVGCGKHWSFRLRTLDWFHIRKKDVTEYLSIGLPSAFQIIFEVSAFVIAAIMMGWISEVTLAAHQIAINVAGATFMVALGISFATSVRIGQYFGQKNYHALRRAGFVGWIINAVFMSSCMVGILIFRHVIPTWFVDEDSVLAMASQLLIVAAFFQVFDGVQIAMMSSLRGMQDVKVPTILVMLVYYGVCLPLAHYLGFTVGWNGMGIWIGLAVGLGLSATGLSIRFSLKSGHLLAIAEQKAD